MSKLWTAIYYYFWMGTYFTLSQEYRPLATTDLGKVRGHYKTSFSQRKFSAFEGIPYAQAPIGEKRFEESQPIGKWYGVWDARFLFECAQVLSTIEQVTISGGEDCLYLNIYVPREHINASEKLDVVVHIHGGAFMIGNGHFYAFPEYLMDHDVIFVTFNYRLGILGFLSTEDEVVPGNNGLKDQVLALKWIQNNIASFGGNPDSVTLTGASAGGASVHLHYLSPMSLGLFKNGLSQSGCALNPWVLQGDALLKTKILASSVGCPEKPSKDLIKCLKQRNHHQILSKINFFYAYKFLPFAPFGPVVEKGSGAFLSQKPYDLILEKRVQDIPWVASFVKHDAGGLISMFKDQTDELKTVWKKLAPFLLHYNYTVPRSQWESVADQVREFYLGKNQEFNDENYDTLVKLVTDRIFVDGIVEAVDLQSRATNASVYLYEMSYTGDTKKTIEHGDDNQYFYYSSTRKMPTENELKMRDVMINMLLTYAKTGKPTVDEVLWAAVQSGHLNILHIAGPNVQDIELRTNADSGDQSFWKSLDLTNNQNNSKKDQ